MPNMQGMISKNAFALRHHEDYISVNRTSVASWQQDIDAIPQNNNRVLCGYGQMNVGRIQAQGFTMDGESVEFQVYARHSSEDKSHAGISSYLSGQKLIGDKNTIYKHIPNNVSADRLSLLIRIKLAKLANEHFVKFEQPQ